MRNKIVTKMFSFLFLIVFFLSSIFSVSSSMTKVYAAGTELQPEVYPIEDNTSNTTIYRWKSKTNLDIQGKTTSNSIYNIDNNNWNDSNGFKCTYGIAGFKFYYLVTDTASVGDNTSSGNTASFNNGTSSNGNGGVCTDSSSKVEFKVITTPSPDKKYVLLDLYAYNPTTANKFLSLRFSADTMLPGNDRCRVILNKDDNVIKMSSDNSNSTGFESFDIIAEDPNYQLDPFNVACACFWNIRDTAGKAWREYLNETGDNDSGISLGWKNIPIRSLELVHRRVAILTRNTTYYVNPTLGKDTQEKNDWTGMTDVSMYPEGFNQNSASYPGAFDKPFKTLAYAINKLGNRKGFICVEDNGAELNDLNISDTSKDITISSSDLKITGNRENTIYTVSVNQNKKITISAGGISFQDINVDGLNGERTTPFITQTGGSVNFSSGTIIKNFKNSNGSALLDCSGTNSKLGMFGTNITNCVSKEGSCAVSYKGKIANSDSDYGFEMNGANLVFDNVNTAGAKANIYLGADRYIQVSESLQNTYTGVDSKISITTEALPTAYVGSVNNENEELVIAKPSSDYPNYSGISTCPFNQFFESDTANNINKISIDKGRTSSKQKFTILKQLGNRVKFRYTTTQGSSLGTLREPAVYGMGEVVNITPDPANVVGYELDSCSVAGGNFTINNNKNDADFAKATGTIDSNDVIITYVYKVKTVTLKFKTNGGNPSEIHSISGQVGKRLNGILSTLTKYGYIFKGWFTTEDIYDFVNGKIDSLPTEFPTEDKTYYAKYDIDPNIRIPVSESHSNADGTIVFYETDESHVANLSVESSVDYTSFNVPGYKANFQTSFVTPSRYIYRSDEEPVGTFSNATQANRVNFVGKMPGEQTLVSFKYDVNPDVRKDFKVKYVVRDENGNESPLNINNVTEQTLPYAAESSITYIPPTKTGYRVNGGVIVSGNEANTTQYITALTGNFDSYNNFKFTGKMPNQNVELKYIYEYTASSKQFIVDYIDNNSNDDRYKYLTDSIIRNTILGDSLSAQKIDAYGYIFSSNEVAPTSAGSFNSQHEFTGEQPLDDNVEVKYRYNRNNNYFKTITYKPSSVIDNTLSVDNKSQDLTMSGTNVTTKVLITTNDGDGWTFEQITHKELVPNVVMTNNQYAQDGFYIETGTDNVYNEADGDILITNETVFTDNATVVPYIYPLFTPVTISFDVEGNGTIDTTGVETTWTSLDTWQDVNPKPTTNGVYYAFDAWYLNGNRVLDTDTLVDGGVYVAKFVKDTSMQDELKKVLYTTTIDQAGNGVIRLRDLHKQYTYLIAKTDGTIIKSKRNGNSQTMTFDHSEGIDINTTYNLYEIKGIDATTIENTYTNVSEIPAANISDATVCYVPAVIKNYTVSLGDNFTNVNKNIANVTISPTSVDFEYALYENGAIVDGTTWQVGNVNGITFENVEAGKTYNVVTRDVVSLNTTDTTGTVIYLDSLYEESSTEYVLAIINGESDGETSLIVPAGTNVSISTTDTDFNKWISLNNKGSFTNNTEANTTFVMPASNVIICAAKANPNPNINITEANFGNENYTVYLDRSDLQSMINSLTGTAERYLANNGFNLEYKWTFNKDILTFEEQNQLNNIDVAKRGAIAIDVDVDRFLDGQRVDNFVEQPVPTGLGLSHQLNQLQNIFGSSIFDMLGVSNDYFEEEGIISTQSEAIEEQTSIEDTTTTTTETDDTQSNEETTIESETNTTEEDTTETNETTTEQLTTTVENIEDTENQNGESSTETDTTTDTNDDTENTEQSDDEEEFGPSASDEQNNIEYEEEPEEDIEPQENNDTNDNEQNDTENYVETTINDTTLVYTTAEENTTFEETNNTEQSSSEIEETERTENAITTTAVETVAGFTDTNTDTNIEELVDNLILFGSNFTNNIQGNIFVTLDTNDLLNGEYKVYKSNGGLTEVPSVISIAEDAGKKGLIGFTAEKGSRYIISYNRYNNVTFINDNPGASEHTTETRLDLRVKYGTSITDTLPDISEDYTYNRASYNDGVWSYKRGSKNDDDLYNQSDLIITPVTLYAVYTTNADDVGGILEKAEEVLNRAREMLQDHFLLNEENNQLSTTYNTLLALFNDDSSNPVDMLNNITTLENLMNEIEPRLAERNVAYDNQNTVKIHKSTSRSGGGSGGGGGGGGGMSLQQNNNLNNQTTLQFNNQLSNQMIDNQLIQAVINNNMQLQNNVNVVTSNGSTKVDLGNGNQAFLNQDGTYVYNDWVQTNVGWYHVGNQGIADKGWAVINNSWYYFRETNDNAKGVMHTGWLQNTFNGMNDIYYMQANGSMSLGYQNINGKTYYFNSDPSKGNIGSLLVNTTTPDGRVINADGTVN